MAKNGNTPRGGPKKSMIGKKLEIVKLIEANKNTSSTSANNQQTTRHRKNGHHQATQRPHNPRKQQPKPIVPGLPEPREALILDRRSLESPTRPLVRLPFEPEIPRALRFERKGVFPFFKLPGEIRNQIYDLAIDGMDFAITWVNNNHKSKSLTYRLPRSSNARGPVLPVNAARERRSLDHKKGKIVQRLPSTYYGPIRTALLLVNKPMHDEASSIFYSKSTFHFHALGTLRHFLDQLTPVAMKSLAKLVIKYRAYGNPQFTDKQIWKAKHDRLWENLCWRVADDCSLTHLSLDMTLNKSPVSFASLDDEDVGLGSAWMKPLWAFQDIKIQRCWVRIRCPTKETAVLEVESWKIRKAILGNAWSDEIESKRDAYGYGKQRLGDKIVNTTMVFRVNADGTYEHVLA